MPIVLKDGWKAIYEESALPHLPKYEEVEGD